MSETVIPYKKEEGSKKAQVEKMFDNISKKYDFLNHFLSLGIDILWRRKALKQFSFEPKHLLDMATGTGDFALEAHKKWPKTFITGVDLSAGMLEIARQKINKKHIGNIHLEKGDSENLPFDDNTFDAATVAFGVRNFENLKKGLNELNRVQSVGGEIVVLEFSKPKHFPVKQLYNFYFKNLLPFFGRMVSKDKSAYTYLPESVQQFPDGDVFLDVLNECGYNNCTSKTVTFGIATIYKGVKV